MSANQEIFVVDATVNFQSNGNGRGSMLRCRVPTTALNELGAVAGDALRFQIRGGQLVGFGVVKGGGEAAQPKAAASASTKTVTKKVTKGGNKGKQAKSNGTDAGLAQLFAPPAAAAPTIISAPIVAAPIQPSPVPIRGGGALVAGKRGKTAQQGAAIFPLK